MALREKIVRATPKGRVAPGDRFGKLVALERTGSASYGDGSHSRSVWRFRCDCGNEIERSTANLHRDGRKIHSCGCHLGGWAKGKPPANKVHNLSLSNLYTVWLSMKGRCYRPSAQGYKNYGGRGIYVSDKWRNDFTAFSEWCHANGYGRGLQLDRIDNDGPYAPENCRWVTRSANNANRRPALYLSRAEIDELVELIEGSLNASPESSVLSGLNDRIAAMRKPAPNA